MVPKKIESTVFLIVFLIVVLIIGCTKSSLPVIKHTSLLGSWRVKEVHWKTKDTTYSITKAQPGIFFFTDSSYATMWTPIDTPRKPFKILSNPTDEELISGFRSVVFNAGNYTHTDTTVISTAFIAKVPGFEGGKQFYRYTIDGKRMRLTMYDETYPNGEKPGWFGKFVTEFVLHKID